MKVADTDTFWVAMGSNIEPRLKVHSAKLFKIRLRCCDNISLWK